MFIRVFIVLFISAVFTAVSPGLPHAQAPGEPKAYRMDEVVVTATRDAQEIRKVPANVTVITSEDIRKSGATSVSEVLNNLEGIHITSFSGNPSQAQVDMRGFGQNAFDRNVILLDGVRLNRPDLSSVNWLEIPISNVERIEVIRGTNSVLYGNSAIGGMINIITKKGEGKPAVDFGLIGGSYAMHNERLNLTGSAEKLSYAVNAENLATDGYRDRSKYTSYGAGANLGYDFSDHFGSSFGFTFSRTDFQLPGYLTKSQMNQDPRQAQPGRTDDDASNNFYNANLLLKSLFGDFGRFDVNLIYGRRDITTNFTSFSYFTEDSLDTLGVTPKYILEKNIFGRTNKLMLGLDYYRDTLDKDTFNNRAHSLKTLVAEMSRESLGGYVRDEFSILKELILALGYRYERAKIDGHETDLSTGNPTFDNEKTHKTQAYEAALTYLFGEKSKAFAKYASTYRIPLLDEQIILTGYLPATFNIDLEKETGKSYELGTLFYPVKDLKFGLTLYRIDMEDEINYDNLGRLVNLDKTRHQGIEFSFSYLLKNVFRLYGNCTFQDAEFREGVNNGNEVPLVPRQMANMGVEVYLPYNLSLRPEARYVGKQYSGGDYDNNLEPLDNYTLYDIFLFYKPQFGRYRVTAFVGVENLTDENYATIGYDFFTQVVYYPSPGITFKGGLSIAF